MKGLKKAYTAALVRQTMNLSEPGRERAIGEPQKESAYSPPLKLSAILREGQLFNLRNTVADPTDSFSSAAHCDTAVDEA
jgi:hypothetical protein